MFHIPLYFVLSIYCSLPVSLFLLSVICHMPLYVILFFRSRPGARNLFSFSSLFFYFCNLVNLFVFFFSFSLHFCRCLFTFISFVCFVFCSPSAPGSLWCPRRRPSGGGLNSNSNSNSNGNGNSNSNSQYHAESTSYAQNAVDTLSRSSLSQNSIGLSIYRSLSLSLSR